MNMINLVLSVKPLFTLDSTEIVKDIVATFFLFT